MDRHVKALLSALRQSVNEAILGSHDVNAALAALSRAGQCPSLSVDVSLGDQSGELLDAGIPGQPVPRALLLTEADEAFMQSLGIALESAGQFQTN